MIHRLRHAFLLFLVFDLSYSGAWIAVGRWRGSKPPPSLPRPHRDQPTLKRKPLSCSKERVQKYEEAHQPGHNVQSIALWDYVEYVVYKNAIASTSLALSQTSRLESLWFNDYVANYTFEKQPLPSDLLSDSLLNHLLNNVLGEGLLLLSPRPSANFNFTQASAPSPASEGVSCYRIAALLLEQLGAVLEELRGEVGEMIGGRGIGEGGSNKALSSFLLNKVRKEHVEGEGKGGLAGPLLRQLIAETESLLRSLERRILAEREVWRREIFKRNRGFSPFTVPPSSPLPLSPGMEVKAVPPVSLPPFGSLPPPTEEGLQVRYTPPNAVPLGTGGDSSPPSPPARRGVRRSYGEAKRADQRSATSSPQELYNSLPEREPAAQGQEQRGKRGVELLDPPSQLPPPPPTPPRVGRGREEGNEERGEEMQVESVEGFRRLLREMDPEGGLVVRALGQRKGEEGEGALLCLEARSRAQEGRRVRRWVPLKEGLAFLRGETGEGEDRGLSEGG